MIITIQNIEQEFTKTGKEYLKVTGVDGNGKETTKSIFDNLQSKWPLVKENTTLEFKMQKNGQFWNVVDILPISNQLPPPQPKDRTLPEHGKVITEAKQEAMRTAPQQEHNPQEVGLAYKILAELYVAGFIDENKPDGKELVLRLKMWLKDVLLPKAH